MHTRWKWPSTVPPARAMHAAGLAAVVAIAGFWGDRLQQLRPVTAPVEKAAAVLPADPAAQAVATWLGPGQVRVNVSVIGLMYRQDRAVAVLAVNGAPPKAFVAGETLLRNVVLSSIASDAVTISHDGVLSRFAAPTLPERGPPGIVRRP
jgi:general secretion pathway protein C